MSEQKNNMLAISFIIVFLITGFLSQKPVLAGSLDPPPEAFDFAGNPVPTDMPLPSWKKKLQCDEAACPRFEIVMDGQAVLDKETGLTWQRDLLDSEWTGSWVVAKPACYKYHFGGRYGWRLPTISELGSLTSVESGSLLPAGHPFINVGTNGYWSSTLNPWSPPDELWAYYFNFNGYPNPVSSENVAGGRHAIWCVRGGSGND